jgi:flagellar motility protein MotE (MotC chaperone)
MLLVDFFHEDWSARCCRLRSSRDESFLVLTGDYRHLPAGATGLEIGAEVIVGGGWVIGQDGPCVPVDKWLIRSDERVNFEISYSGVTPPMAGFGAYNLVLPPGWRFDVIQVDNPNYDSGPKYMVARDDKDDREAVMLYFQGPNTQFNLTIQATRGSGDSRDLDARIYSRCIVEPSPADMDTQIDLEDASTHSGSAIVPPSKPLKADSTSVARDAADAGDQGVTLSPVSAVQPETDSADQGLADEIAAKNPYDAADELALLPSSQAAHILTLMNPTTALRVLTVLSNDATREILLSLEPDTLVAMLGPFDYAARILELAEVRLAAATLSKMQESSDLSGGMVLREMKPQPAAAIIDEMTRGELDKAHYFSTGASPDPLYRLIDYVSIERSLFLMSRTGAGRAAKLLENMAQRNSERVGELLREMEPGLAGRIFSEMEIDTARGLITRMDAASAARLLETMPPKKLAILRKSIEELDEY